VRLRPLGGGLSAARVIRVEVVDEHGSVVSRAVAKLASLSRATTEASQFRQYVLPQLGSGAFAHLIDEVRAGACRTGGLFYWFASGDGEEQAYELPLFALLPSEEQLAVRAIEGLKAKLRPWVAAAHQTAVRIGEVRQLLVTDSEMLEIRSELAFDLDALEERTIYVNQGPEHGDLHGLNVLVRADGDAVIIDFASTISAPVALDPVTLELSLLFHPDSPIRVGGWPSLEQARKWASQAAYCEGSPVMDFIAECRSWAHDRAASDVEIFAVAYAYALRQLKFEGTDHDRAVAIAASAIEGIESA
jgi:hypothetical protein